MSEIWKTRHASEAIGSIEWIDKITRQMLRREMDRPGGPRIATGRDVALLDFGQVALQGLGRWNLDHGSPLAESEIPTLAFLAASVYLDRVLSRPAGSGSIPAGARPKTLVGAISRILQISDLTGAQTAAIARSIARGFQEHRDSICADCQVACLGQPDAPMESIYRGDVHPATLPRLPLM